MILHLRNVDLENIKLYESDIMLNKSLTNKSPSNMYEILFDSENFYKIISLVLEQIINTTNEDYNVYVKNMWGFVQNEIENQPLNITSSLLSSPWAIKEELSIKAKYTFIYIIKSFETILKFNGEDIVMREGDLIIFDNENFIADKSKDINRVILIGSLTNNLYYDNSQKKLL